MYVDASIIVAILTREPKWQEFVALLENSNVKLVTSVIAVWEATVALYRKKDIPMAEAEAHIAEFLRLADIETMPVTGAELSPALAAFEKYGRHRYPDETRNSALNLADCFHYASAKSRNVAIMTKDAGFGLTDVETIGL
jgi:ribonuclease VapC